MTRTSRDIDGYDVAVIGAGPAGVCAASAAAKSASVVLIDSTHRFGGSVTAAMHRCMCGLYCGPPDNPLDTLNDGAQRSIVERMLRMEPGAVVPRHFGKAWVLEFPASAWEASLGEMCAEAKVDLRMGARVTEVRREGSRLTAVKIQEGGPSPYPSPGVPGEGKMLEASVAGEGKIWGADLPSEGKLRRVEAMGEDCWITARVVIDCTGGGHVLRLAGEDTFLPPEDARMLGGYAVRLAGIAGDPDMLRLQTPFALAKAVEKGFLPELARFTVFYPGPGQGEGVCKLAVNPEESGAGAAELLADRVVEVLTREVSGFALAKVVEKSPRILPRDGLRLRGRYVLSEADVLRGRKHGSDSVHAWWPIEKWEISRGPTYAYPPLGDHYDIPSDALRSAAVDNLFAAGCCLSATSAAAASSRASGICLATGEMAGRLAVSALI